MLKGIPSLIGPELLASLARMGHGDELVVVDRNYPAYAAGVPVHRIDGSDTLDAMEAILSLLPVDDFVEQPVYRMRPVDGGGEPTELQERVAALVERVEGRPIGVEPVERFAFYRRAAGASAVVATGESLPYGCFGLIKGVVR
ncbi:RbsD/FucU family protein [Okibacterium endophyticum]